MHIIFLMSATLLYGCSYASPAVDSLPSCILKMKQKDSLLIIYKYDYKGQQWFGIKRILTEQEMKKVNYIKTTVFYNTGCKPVATWRTGGNFIIRVDAILPDSIDKTKIIRVADDKVPENIMQFPVNRSNALPDSIVRLALAKNCSEVKEYLYQEKILYTFRYPLYSQQLPEKGSVTIDVPYYDKNGKVVLTYKRAIEGRYSRAEQWVPASVKRGEVTAVPNGFWLREKNTYKKVSNPK